MDANQIVTFLRRSGVVVTTAATRHLSVAEAARALDVSTKWVRDHLDEFPGTWRLPGAGQAGELRIPADDVNALAERRRLAK